MFPLLKTPVSDFIQIFPEAAIHSSFGEKRYLKSRQNPWKLPVKEFLFYYSFRLEAATLLKRNFFIDVWNLDYGENLDIFWLDGVGGGKPYSLNRGLLGGYWRGGEHYVRLMIKLVMILDYIPWNHFLFMKFMLKIEMFKIQYIVCI